MDQLRIERINTKEQSVASAESVYVCAWGLISLFSHQCLYITMFVCMYAFHCLFKMHVFDFFYIILYTEQKR